MNVILQPNLENDLLILRPLREEDLEDRCQKNGFEVFFREAIKSKGAFIVIDKTTGEVIGSTRFFRLKKLKMQLKLGGLSWHVSIGEGSTISQ